MPTLNLEIITAENQVFFGDVNTIVAPGIEGQLGILPHHAPLMTILHPGELFVRKDSEETYMAITGGFLEVRPDKVIILADACERVEEINIARAEEAKKRAEQMLKQSDSNIDTSLAEAALRRSMVRLQIAERRRRKPKINL